MARKKFFTTNREIQTEDKITYVIGDIHGEHELLKKTHELIIEDVKNYPEHEKEVIYLGDYVDKGDNPKEVIEELVNNPLSDFKQIYLLGNHDDELITFLDETKRNNYPAYYGAINTLKSYGIEIDYDKENFNEYIREELHRKIPEEHKDFLRDLKIYHETDEALFVHAGIRPDIPIEAQTKGDLLKIREDFFLSKRPYEKTVIFGHTDFDKPFVGNNILGIDTGAYRGGKLTTLVIAPDNKFRLLEAEGREKARDRNMKRIKPKMR